MEVTSMQFTTIRRAVVITESAIKSEVVEFITALGAKGYTIDTVSGRGDRGVREDDAMLGDYLRNVKIEMVVPAEIAEKIVGGVVEKFFKNYGGIAYMHDVQIVRRAKF